VIWHTNKWHIEETEGTASQGYDPVHETLQQISSRKIAFAEHVPVQCSVSEAFHEKKSRQHSIDETTSCTGASRGVRDEFSPNGDCIKRMLIYPRYGQKHRTAMLHQLTSRLLFWSRVATQKDDLGSPKYNNMVVVVKAASCISHGHADVERGFSINKYVVNEVTLKQHTISAIRTVKDVINKYKAVEQTDSLFMAFTVHRLYHYSVKMTHNSRKK